MSARTDDPYQQLPLEGVQLIEASAGTGKTYTLATLVQRLVLERSLRIGQILAVTFTEAATQELRKRIRERLQLTLDLLDAAPGEDDSSEVALTHALLQRRRAAGGEPVDALRQRLRLATLETDLAAIFTIHGFCARVLRDHALQAGGRFEALTLLKNDVALREEVAADLWRRHAQTAEGADDLLALWPGGHAQMAEDLREWLGEEVLLPPDAPLPEDPAAACRLAAEALVEAMALHLDDARALIAQAFDQKILHGLRAKRASFDKAFSELQEGREARHWPRGKGSHLDKLLPSKLLDFCYDEKRDLVPVSPLFDAFAHWLEADARVREFNAMRRAQRLHRLRHEARARLAQLKRQRQLQGYDDLIAGVADALAGDHGDALARALRDQYAVALVDEFQDTDARQWAIFNRVFGKGADAPALFLIGDPKQAIYAFRGGDVHAYLAAADSASKAPPLGHNFRSRPAVLAAIDRLYAHGKAAVFVDPRIRFKSVQPGGKRRDGDYLRHGVPAPGLTLWRAPATGNTDKKGSTSWDADESRRLATDACAAHLHAVLSDARSDRALIDGQPVQPGDIAVLVRTHREATLIQQALVALGIPAVAAGKLSLFATGEARDLHALLLALQHGADDGRLRAALATVLLGQDARAIDALERDGPAHHYWQQQAQRWRDWLRGGGPLALVGKLCAEHGERLLALDDGERRLANYLQLAELLQDAQRQALGLHGLVDWLARAIAEADGDDDAQQLRLESDARCVQIVTLHKSKGLEYPLVYLPFVGVGANEKSPARQCIVHEDEHGRRLHRKLDTRPDDTRWSDAVALWREQQRGEDARLLYVGLTRAKHALWVATGPFFQHGKTPLASLLGDLDASADALRQAGIAIDTNAPAATLPRLTPQQQAAVPPARHASRPPRSDWWVHSFSQLARVEAGEAASETASAATLPAPGGHDEPAPEPAADTAEAFDPRFAGNRYGVALHAALEHADFAAWRSWRSGDPAPADQAGVIAAALRAEGYADAEIADGVALSSRLIGHTLTVALPEGARLCDIPPAERRPEIEFQFALQPVQADALLALLHAHGIVRDRDRFGARQRLEGLMTGLIDLTYRHAGQWYVLDYKSNRLAGYDAASLQRAMTHSEYDLQALIYTLALHRWLRFRLGNGYDYARDFGGIRYLFCRGLDAARADSPGIHAQRFAPELVHALDALFGHAQGAAA